MDQQVIRLSSFDQRYETQTISINVSLGVPSRVAMRKHYLHLSAYSCDKCGGPVISGSTTVRENEISKESEIRQVGAICLSCGHRQSAATPPGVTQHFPPVQWNATKIVEPEHLVSAYFEEVNRKEVH
jgi:RNase P subunit RPR2